MTRRAHGLRRLLATALATPLLFVACDDPTIPEGEPGIVEARAFVDVDGNGTFGPGDEAVASASIELARAGTVVATATTDGEGMARFIGVRPDGYTVRFAGAAPTGAVLAGTGAASVAVPAQGGTVEASFRFVYRPGEVRGVVFRDDDADDAYGADGDLEIAGTVLTISRGAVETEVSTGEDGTFVFPTLRPGEWTLRIAPPSPLELAGDSVRTLTVGPAQTIDLAIEVTGRLAVPIAEARAAELGTVLAVEGIVTVDQGAWGSRSIQIQDGTAGINIFLQSSDSDLGLVAGDSVRMLGPVREFNGELNLSQPVVTVLGKGTVPEPRAVTGTEMLARTYEGELAALGLVTVQEISVFSFDTHNVTVTTADGSSVVLRVDSRTGIASADWTVGGQYVVTGILRSFRGTPQLYLRSPADQVEPAPATAIADARAAEDGTTVTVVGIVTADQGTFDFRDRDTYLQDATGGLRLWALDAALGLKAGERVRVTGTMDTFNDERQLSVDEVLRVGQTAVPDPKPVTAAQINAFESQGQLAVTDTVTVVSVQGFSFDAHNVTVEDRNGATFQIRVESPNEIATDFWVQGRSYLITGILGRFRGTAQIKPRGPSDVQEL